MRRRKSASEPEAADIMHRFYPARGERMLDELRALNIGHQRIPQDNEEVITMNRRQQPAVIPDINNSFRTITGRTIRGGIYV